MQSVSNERQLQAKPQTVSSFGFWLWACAAVGVSGEATHSISDVPIINGSTLACYILVLSGEHSHHHRLQHISTQSSAIAQAEIMPGNGGMVHLLCTETTCVETFVMKPQLEIL